MRADWIVEAFDVIEDGSFGLGASRKAMSVDEIHFKAAPKAFHGGVVVAVAPPAHGGDEAGAGQSRPILGGGILNTPIGVKEKILWMAPMEQRHVKGVQDEWGIDAIAHGPSDHFAAVEVEDGRAVEPAFLGVHVGDVSHPDLIGCHRRRRFGQAVGSNRMVVVALGGLDAVAALLTSAEALQLHETGHAVASVMVTLFA